MSLNSKQWLFTRLVATLLRELHTRGYEITFGDTYRSPEAAALNAKKGVGISNSLHILRMAIDLNLFKKGKLLEKVSDYKEAGEIWEAMSSEGLKCCWGGRFKRPDAYHFSIEHDGVR